mgnify:CR=1 FL=1
MKIILTIVSLFVSVGCFCQITAIHFNAEWNDANKVEWFGELSDIELDDMDISDGDCQKKYEIAVVPTIVIFDDGEEVKRFQADLSFKLVATKKEIQNYIDELIISKF